MQQATTVPRSHFAALGSFLFHHREALFPFAYLSVWLPGPRVFHHPLMAIVIGLAIALIGQLIRVATIGLDYVVRGTETLATSGVYAHCRNPMYVGNLLILGGVAVGSNSWTCVMVAGLLFILVSVSIVAAEESLLRHKFGLAFDEYCRDVPRWMPRWTGFVAMFRSTPFRWRGALVEENGTLFRWVLGFSVLTLWHLYRLGQWAEQDELVQMVMAIVIAAIVVRLRVRNLKKARQLVAD